MKIVSIVKIHKVMKKIYVFVLLMCISLLGKGQEWVWSNQLASSNEVLPADMAIDNNNNVYLIGTYMTANLTIQGTTISNHGDRDGFVCKFSPDGTLQWLKSIGGSDREFAVSVVIVDGTLYVAGDFRSSIVYFTPTDSLINTNNFDAFLAKYDLNGNCIDAIRIFYGSNVERIKGMIYNNTDDNLIIIGQFQVEFKYFDGSSEITVLPRIAGRKDHFVVKVNSLGEVQDTMFFQSPSLNTILKDVNLASTEGFYVAGDVFDQIQFSNPSDIIIGNSTTTADAFIVKLNSTLDFQWARKGGGIGYDHVNSSISDKYGNVYLTGKVESTISFDSTATLQSHIIPEIGAQDLYLAKYNKLGTLQWIKRKGDIGNDDGYGITQKENLIQFCGNISGEVIFNVDTLRSSGISDVNTGFAIFNTTGDEIGAQGIGGSGTDRGEVIEFSPNGNTIIGGFFDSPNLEIGDSIYINSSGTNDGFIASYYYPMNAVFTTIDDIKCNGGNDGRLIVTPYFGVGPYSYSWSPNVTSYNDSLANNLSADTYSVTVTDSRFVNATNTIVLTEPSAITIGSSYTDVSCHPLNGISNDGTIDLTVSGGTVTGLYDYSWEAISGSGVNASSEDQTTLTMGQYSVTVTDDNLCEAYDTFAIDQPDSIIFTGSIVIPATGGSNNGAINLTVSGGNDAFPYDYLWSNSETTEDIINLYGGNYSVTVTDILSCSEDTTFLVQDLSLFQAYISNKVNVDCHGYSTGSATVSVTGGTGPYSYAWQNSVGNPVGGDSPILSDIPRGTYYVTVTDNFDSRTAQTSAQIQEPAQDLLASITGTNLECYGDNSGIADLTVSGGTLQYTFHWNNNSSTEDLVNLSAGHYFVTITDKNGCIATDDVEITQPSAMDINITIDQPIFCHGDLSGILTATATGGTGTKFYIWDDPGNQTTQTATGLEAGTYGVTATDINGCFVTDQINLSDPNPLILSEVHQNVMCYGGSDGIINLSVSGGTPQYNYDWSNGQISQDISNLTADTYIVTVTDANNCIANLSTEITEPESVSYQFIELNQATCYGYADGSIVLIGQGGVGGYQYSIDGGLNYSSDNTFTDILAGSYILRIRDNNNCESSDSTVTIGQPEGTTLVSTTLNDVTCYGYSDGSLIITATSSIGGLTYSIDEGITFLDNNGLFTNLSAGNYTIWIRDGNGCEQEFPEVIITQPEAISIDTNITHAVGAGLGEIEIMASGGTPPYNYYIHSISIDSSATGGVFVDLIPDDYLVYVTDENICSSDTLVVVILQKSTALIIYDAFSPNNDGLNEVWNIGNIDMFPDCEIAIFNIWGNKVFSSRGYPEPWDGKYNGKNLPAGTYYYIIDLRDGSDPLSGPVSIVR
jgi:gliding motility-associated-like protein